jgi:hypothetical protein
VAVQFAGNLKRIKQAMISWSHEKKIKEEQELRNIELTLQKRMAGYGQGFHTQVDKQNPVNLEKRRRIILEEKEALWRLKSRSIWLSCGDENTKFFQAYAKGRKMANTIWELKKGDGEVETLLMASMGIEHFCDLFKVHEGSSIAEIVQVARLFPHFVEEEDNQSLMAAVTEKELLEVIHYFQKGKILGPDGWPIEFYLGFFNLIGQDVLKVVEESRVNGHIHDPLNSTFISLIPKSDNPSSFDDFRPIYLCNCLYKIISKVISRRLKIILSRNISSEQFGFFGGKADT